jgi:putative ABC transport system permease protein
METLCRDVRYAVRSLRKQPGLSLVVILTLALGIGANTAIFSVVDAVLLSPLPYSAPDKLVVLSAKNEKQNVTQQPISYPNLVDLKEQNQVFENLSAIRGESFSLTDRAEPERVVGVRVSANILSLLGVQPALGRSFLPEEEQPAHASVALMSYGLWQQRYAGDPHLIGQAITLDGRSYTVIGILPAWLKNPGLTLANLPSGADVWIPVIPAGGEQNRNFANMRMIARLRPGVTLAQAQAEMDTLSHRLEQQYPDSNTNLRLDVVGLRDQLTGRVRNALWILLGVVGCVLLIACANVANLFLARAASRQSEVAVRTALGATRRQLIRELLTECMVLSLSGGLFGLLLAYLGVVLLTSLSSGSIPRVEEIGMSLEVLLFTLCISVLTGLVFGIVPAFQSSRFQLTENLKESKKGASGGIRQRRSLNALVVIEIALALVLATGAGLMMRSFRSVLGVDAGFDPRNVLTFSAALPQATYRDQQQHLLFYERALARIQALPGVQSAAGTFRVPITGFATAIFTVQGKPVPVGQAPSADYRAITTDYFRAMGIRVLKGREFSERDTGETPDAVIVNEELARLYWAGEDPIGKRLQVGTETTRWREVVGVVAGARLTSLEAKADPAIYIPFPQNTWPNALRNSFIVVRSGSDPLRLIPAIRRELRSIDPALPIAQIRTMDEIVGGSLLQRRFNTTLLALFALLAGALAAVGIYGVMSYAVTQRTREVGIRMALGARRSDITMLVTGTGARLAAGGVAIGVVAALISTRLLSGLLFGVTATDPMTFVLTALTLGAVTLLASYIPSRRAASTDPITALRYD